MVYVEIGSGVSGENAETQESLYAGQGPRRWVPTANRVRLSDDQSGIEF
jgi:hypothetical protein